MKKNVKQKLENDVIQCLEGLYHNTSKDFHGKTEGAVPIHESSWSNNERIALASIFEYCNIRYVIVDKNGYDVVPRPY